MAENFRTQILNSKDGSVGTHAPVRTLGSCTFMYLRHSDLYILMVTKNNANTMMAFKYMTSVSSCWLATVWCHCPAAEGRPHCDSAGKSCVLGYLLGSSDTLHLCCRTMPQPC